ncbi:hypothetical protein KR009_008799 [Drosophila setifemur]|nr:hypothetical protein KR009_008799 [Drosophila setifemur]
MASKVELQYKQLNAELMDQVQKQRMMIAEYRSQVIELQREIIDMREMQILQKETQRLKNMSLVRSLMRGLDLDADGLMEDTLTISQKPESPLRTQGPNRRTHQRRSLKEICQDMQRSCVLARTTRTLSPSSRRSSDIEIDSASSHERRPSLHTPQPKRLAELQAEQEDSHDDSMEISVGLEEPTEAEKGEKIEQNQMIDRLCSIMEDTTESSDSSSSSSAINCDESVDESTPPERPREPVLRDINTNVPDPRAVTIKRGYTAVKPTLTFPFDESAQELSIQHARQAPFRSTNSPSVLSTSSLVSISDNTPRRSLFVSQLPGHTHTSTPRRSVDEEPILTRGKSKTSKAKLKENSSLNSSYLSTSGRPSRSCRPTNLREPSLRDKMRSKK